MPSRAASPFAAAILIWLVLVAVGLVTRPPLPVDETRYLAVAWEMWRSGDYLVPRLNGIAYHHKPPMLFWLMNAGWAAVGVSEIWARLVAPLFALGSLCLTAWLARLVFPSAPAVAGVAPLIAIGALVLTLFASLTYFDTMLTFFTLLGLCGVALASRGRAARGWTLTALALGLGILSKGPVQLLDLAPVPLLAPLWIAERPFPWKRWYGGFVFATVAGAAIALAWAGPAAIAGGPDFAYMLFLGQTTQRVVETMWHERPWWWYVPAVFVMAFPWMVWPALWRSLAARRVWTEPGVRFCLAMLVPLFVAFSAISGKQPHYMLPMIPVLALLLARFAVADGFADGRWWRLPPLAVLAVLAVALLVFAAGPARFAGFEDALTGVPAAGGATLGVAALLIALVLLLVFDRPRGPAFRTGTLAAAMALLIVVVHLVVFGSLRPRYDGSGIGTVLARAEAEGRPVGHIGDYHGQYHFAGRLSRPFATFHEFDAVTWAAANPAGLVIDYRQDDPATFPRQPLYAQAWRGRFVVVWPAAAVQEFGEELLMDARMIEERRRAAVRPPATN